MTVCEKVYRPSFLVVYLQNKPVIRVFPHLILANRLRSECVFLKTRSVKGAGQKLASGIHLPRRHIISINYLSIFLKSFPPLDNFCH